MTHYRSANEDLLQAKKSWKLSYIIALWQAMVQCSVKLYSKLKVQWLLFLQVSLLDPIGA